MRPKTRAIVLGAALATGATVAGIDWRQYIQQRYPNGSPVPPVINTKQTTLSGGAPLPVSCASGKVSSCMATANQNLLVSACKEVNATAPTASTKSTSASTIPKKCEPSNQIDFGYLNVNENDSVPPALTGYVPHYSNGQVIGASGVTIGIGVDLGQQSVSGLEQWGIGNKLISILKSYMSPLLRGQAALTYLNKHPLSLTITEVSELDKGARNFIIGQLISDFNRGNKIGTTFFYLPAGTQTALADFFYQHGAYSDIAYPELWNAVINGNWSQVATLLPLEPGQPRTRLMKDGILVKRDVTHGDFLPNGQPKCQS